MPALNPFPPRKISVEEYITFAQGWSPHLPFDKVVVSGDVNLGKIRNGASVKFLPPAAIEGDLIAGSIDLGLEEAYCEIMGDALFASQSFRSFAGKSVSGEFVAEGCLGLKYLGGEFGKSVNLSRSGIRKLDKNFKCAGNLDVTGCRFLEEVNSRIGGSLNAKLSGLKKIGTQCVIGGDVDISHCAQLRRLGKVGSPQNVTARSAALEEISPDFFCQGSLTLQLCHCLETVSGTCGGSATVLQSSLIQLKKFTCGGSLSIRHCSEFKKLEASVAEDIDLSDCESLTRLSSSCRPNGVLRIGAGVGLRGISGHFKAEVNLFALEDLKEITANFSCDRDLLLRNCGNLEKICGRIGGNLVLHGSTSVSSFSEECKVSDSIVISADRPSGDLPKFPRKMVFSGKIPKDLRIQRVPVDIVTESSFCLGGDFSASHCRSVLLVGSVSGSVFLENTFVNPMGADLEISKNLKVVQCAGPSKANCQIVGDARFVDSGIEATGVAFHCQGAVTFENCKSLKKVHGNFEGGVEFVEPKAVDSVPNMPPPLSTPVPLPRTLKNSTSPTPPGRPSSSRLNGAVKTAAGSTKPPSSPIPLPKSLGLPS